MHNHLSQSSLFHTQVSIELIKVLMEQPIECYKNAFLNLALPSVVFSEPAPPIRTVINEQHSFTLWDQWEVKGHKNMKLQEFLKTFNVRTKSLEIKVYSCLV